MIVMKFGGTSVKDTEAYKRVAEIILAAKGKKLIVVSAISGVTNLLTEINTFLETGKHDIAMQSASEIELKHIEIVSGLDLEDELGDYIKDRFREVYDLIRAISFLGEITDKSRDMILSYGEIISSKILASYLNKKTGTEHIDSRELLKTDSNFTMAEVEYETSSELVNELVPTALNNDEIVVCGGFIASDDKGNTTTLGRGGSDYTAALFASMLGAERLEIWTDVDGIMSSDPRIVSNARRILRLSYIEAAELAYFGAKVLHPKTIYPAIKANIPVYIRNSFRPEVSGTEILNDIPDTKIIKSIAYRKGVTVINIHSNRMLGAYGFLFRVFEIFSKHRTSVDIVTTSEVSISLTIDNDEKLEDILEDLDEFATAIVSFDKAIISAIGEGIRDTTGIAARFFGVLEGINVKMVSIGASEVNISIVVDESDLEAAVETLHNEFFRKIEMPEVFQAIEN